MKTEIINLFPMPALITVLNLIAEWTDLPTRENEQATQQKARL
jgi:hypothetical protein